MVEHAAEGITGAAGGVADCVLDRLADRPAQTARGIRIILQHLTAGPGVGARAGDTLRAPGLHHQTAERLLIETDPHHIDLALQSEQGAGERQSAAPLARAGLGGDPGHAGQLVVVGLRHGGIGLVAAGGAEALVFVVDARRRAQNLFQPESPHQGRWPPHFIDPQHLFGNVDPALRAHLQLDQVHREDRSEHLRRYRLAVRTKRRRGGAGKISGDVVVLARHFAFVEQDLGGLHGFPPWG